MFGYWEKEERNRLTDYLYKEMSPEALMLYALLEFHDYNRKEDTYCNKRNRVMRPEAAAEQKKENNNNKENKMKRCIRCNSELTGKQRKFCSKKCSRQKEVAKFRSSYKPVDDERRQKVKDYAEGRLELTHEEKQKLWWDIDSYRQLFGGGDK